MDMATILETHLTTSEACKRLAIRRRKLGDLLVDQAFPNAFRITPGGQWRIPESDIIAWIERRRAATTTKSTTTAGRD